MTEQIRQQHNVAAAVLVRDDTVLLCHRHPERQWYPNVWDVPGGHIEPGETSIVALVRELGEELAIRIDPAHAVSVLSRSPKPDLHVEFWAVDKWCGDIVNAQPDEHDAIAWFRLEEIGQLDVADPDVVVACRRSVELFGDGKQA